MSLQRHIQEGWGISSAGLGEFIYCVPAQQKVGTDWYRGTADAIRQNLDLAKRKGIDHVLILSGDHVYKMDYVQMLSYHKLHNASMTISTVKVQTEDAAGRLGVLEVDQGYRVTSFSEKPTHPKSIPDSPRHSLSSMGVYVFKPTVLLDVLKQRGDDFGRHIIPRMISDGIDIFAYNYSDDNKIEDYINEITEGQRKEILVDRTRDSSYWVDVGTLDSYYKASMDLVNVDPIFNLYGKKWLIRTCQKPLPPSKCILGGRTSDSIVSDGCIISGAMVHRSILSPGVAVDNGTVVEESIIFDDVVIEPHVKIKKAIIDKEARIRRDTHIGYDLEADKKRGCTLSEEGVVVVPRNMEVAPI
jgi:glucose-1-phosphate adenylyltransferase